MTMLTMLTHALGLSFSSGFKKGFIKTIVIRKINEK